MTSASTRLSASEFRRAILCVVDARETGFVAAYNVDRHFLVMPHNAASSRPTALKADDNHDVLASIPSNDLL